MQSLTSYDTPSMKHGKLPHCTHLSACLHLSFSTLLLRLITLTCHTHLIANHTNTHKKYTLSITLHIYKHTHTPTQRILTWWAPIWALKLLQKVLIIQTAHYNLYSTLIPEFTINASSSCTATHPSNHRHPHKQQGQRKGWVFVLLTSRWNKQSSSFPFHPISHLSQPLWPTRYHHKAPLSSIPSADLNNQSLPTHLYWFPCLLS